MALVAIDGFDMYNGAGSNTGMGAKWYPGAGTPGGGNSMITGRFGGQCVRYGPSVGGRQHSRFFTTPRTAGANGFGFRSSVAISNNPVVTFGVASNGLPQFGFVVGGSGQFLCVRPFQTVGGGNPWNSGYQTVLGSSDLGVIPENGWIYTEVEWTLSAGAGTVKLYVEGVKVMDLAGVNNMAQTAAGFTNGEAFYVGSGQGNIDYDDYYEADTNTRVAPMRIDTLRGASDNVIQLSRSTGSNNYGNINENLVDGDTSYNYTGVVGQGDLYGLGPLPVTPTTIYGVQCVDFAYKTDANPRTFYQQLKSGATLDLGAPKTLVGTYNRFDRILLNDPDTSAPWTAAAVNALLRGPQLAS